MRGVTDTAAASTEYRTTCPNDAWILPATALSLAYLWGVEPSTDGLGSGGLVRAVRPGFGRVEAGVDVGG